MSKPSHNALKNSAADAAKTAPAYRSALKAPDILSIANQSPDRAYRWVSKSLLEKNGGYDRRGWEVLNETNSKGEKLGSAWGAHTSGTSIQVGDLVACFMPIERAEMRRAALKEANNALSGQVQSLRNQARRSGGQITGTVDIQSNGVTEQY